MALFTRPDSPYYWMWIEGTNIRKSTGVPVRGGSPKQDRELQRQAEEIYAAAKADAAKRAAGLLTAKPAITFAAYVVWYDTHVAAHRRGYTRDKSILKQLAKAFGSSVLLSAIDAHAVQEWRTKRLKAGLKPSTVNRELDVLKSLLNSAVPKYLERAPLSEVRRLRVAEQEPRILTRDEEDRLLAVADDEARAILIVALDTLMRLSNVANLQWAHVKWHAQAIVPLNAKVSHDKVPITARMAAALKALPVDGPWVFVGLHLGTGKTAAKNRVIRLFDQLCQQAGLPHSRAAGGLTFHCLRHTGATRALQAGASVRTVMKLGGWKDLRSVLRYTHAADIDVMAAAESIGRPLGSRADKSA